MNSVLLFYVPNPCSIVIVVDNLDQDAADASESQLRYNGTVTCYIDYIENSSNLLNSAEGLEYDLYQIKVSFAENLCLTLIEQVNHSVFFTCSQQCVSVSLDISLCACLPIIETMWAELSNIKAASF